jgi:hypothetical protein
MSKLLSNLRLKARRVILSFPISLISTLVLISLLKYKNIIYINNETSDKIHVII